MKEETKGKANNTRQSLSAKYNLSKVFLLNQMAAAFYQIDTASVTPVQSWQLLANKYEEFRYALCLNNKTKELSELVTLDCGQKSL